MNEGDEMAKGKRMNSYRPSYFASTHTEPEISSEDEKSLSEESPADEIPASFYDEEYFTAGTKSNYKPYDPGVWARRLARLIHEVLRPESVLDAGCAYGYVVSVLNERGVPAWGFDASEYAISRSTSPDRTWVGLAEDESSYRVGDVDLVMSTEMLEHLSERQIELFLERIKVGRRALLLVGIEGGKEMHDDGGHVTFKPTSWWREMFAKHGWNSEDTSAFDSAAISQQMGWSGRFFLLSKDAAF